MEPKVRVDRAGGGRGALAVVVAAGRGGALGVAAATAAAVHRLERVEAHGVEEQQSHGAVGDGELRAGKTAGVRRPLSF